MRSITPHLTNEFLNKGITAKNVASKEAYEVSTYSELRQLIAKLSYVNKDFILFFRGKHPMKDVCYRRQIHHIFDSNINDQPL